LFRGFAAAMSESRARFTEYAQAIMQGLETGVIDHAGEFYNQPRIAIRPAPIRSFRDRTYAASVSPESLEILCQLGLGLLIIAQKPWETTEAELRAYRSRFLAVNGYVAPKPLIATFIAVHEAEAGARDMFEKYIRNYGRSALDHYEFHNEGLADIPGYEYYGKLAANIRKHGVDAFVNWLAELQVWGTPEQVYNKLVEQHHRAESGGLIGAFSYGGMQPDLAKRNIALFANPCCRGYKHFLSVLKSPRHRSVPPFKFEIGVQSCEGAILRVGRRLDQRVMTDLTSNSRLLNQRKTKTANAYAGDSASPRDKICVLQARLGLGRIP